MKQRIVVDEDAGHAGEIVTREEWSEPVFAGTGSARGEYETAIAKREQDVEYTPPGRWRN